MIWEASDIVFALFFIAIIVIAIGMILHEARGFEMTDQLKQDEQLSQICTTLNLETAECWEIIGDIESQYEPNTG